MFILTTFLRSASAQVALQCTRRYNAASNRQAQGDMSLKHPCPHQRRDMMNTCLITAGRDGYAASKNAGTPNGQHHWLVDSTRPFTCRSTSVSDSDEPNVVNVGVPGDVFVTVSESVVCGEALRLASRRWRIPSVTCCARWDVCPHNCCSRCRFQ